MLNEKIASLEKETSQSRGKINALQNEISSKETQLDKVEQQKRELEKLLAQGKDVDKLQLEKISNELKKERKDFERQVNELNQKLSETEKELARARAEVGIHGHSKETLKEQVKSQVTSGIFERLEQFRKKLN